MMSRRPDIREDDSLATELIVHHYKIDRVRPEKLGIDRPFAPNF
jgi:hypothetical protein